MSRGVARIFSRGGGQKSVARSAKKNLNLPPSRTVLPPLEPWFCPHLESRFCPPLKFGFCPTESQFFLSIGQCALMQSFWVPFSSTYIPSRRTLVLFHCTIRLAWIPSISVCYLKHPISLLIIHILYSKQIDKSKKLFSLFSLKKYQTRLKTYYMGVS